jgi:hypothetical protein
VQAGMREHSGQLHATDHTAAARPLVRADVHAALIEGPN